jgi:hypothetical protein
VTRIAATRDPLAGVSRLIVDATNLLYALTRGPDRQPPAALIGRIRAAIPATAAIELVFDGPPEHGLAGSRIAHGVTVRYGGRLSADTLILSTVERLARDAGPAATDALLVVSDDREVRGAATRQGARTAGTAWLVRRLERPRLASPSVANRRPPHVAQPPPGEETGPARSPGRPRRRRNRP